MNHIQHTILVWSLVCAGLLIVVLYSPIGSPHFYALPDYSPGVWNLAPINARIANVPKIHAISPNSQDESILPELSTLTPTNRGIANFDSKSNHSTGPFNRSTQYSSYHNVNRASNGVSGSPFLAGGGMRNSAGASSVIMTNGITTLSLTSDMSKNISKQNMTEQTSATDGTSDPGDEPFGDTIPVGDGWGLLVFLGVCYAFFKRNLK